MRKITPSPPSLQHWSLEATSKLKEIIAEASTTASSTSELEVVKASTLQQEQITESSNSELEEIISEASTTESSTSELEVAEVSTLQQEQITEPSNSELEEIITETSTTESSTSELEVIDASSPSELEEIISDASTTESSTSTSKLEVAEVSTLQQEQITESTSKLQEIISDTSTLQQEEVTEASTPQLEEIITEDGILCNILSFLSLSEAVRTSVLSSRWRCIWTGLTKFEFDASSVLGAHTLTEDDLATKEIYELTKGKTSKFVRIVNSIVRQLQGAGATLDTFTVRYFLDKRHSRYIDAWVRFALASKTRVLKLHLFRSYTEFPKKPYEFECQLLGSSPSTETLAIFFCKFKLPFEFNCFRHLKRLCISEVDATEEGFNCILSSCSSTIMKLGVVNTPQWTTISVPHPLSQLQHLLVYACNQVRKIEINAINLSRLTYLGAPVDFRFRQSTKLIEAEIYFKTGGTIHSLDFYLTNLSSTLPHLQSLTLNITHVSKLDNLPKDSSRFIHLTCLNWEWSADVEMSLLHLITLLDVAPYLQQLKLCLLKRVLEQPPQAPTKFRELLSKHSHTHLKTVQVSGFYFDTWQIEVAAYLLNNATGLESMMIETGSTVIGFDSEQIHEREYITEDIQERGTEILNPEIPADVKLVIL